MQYRSAIVFVIDRLGAGQLGPYGNTWVETPNFNQLAAQSLLCEQAFGDSPRLDDAYRAYWTAQHCLQPRPSSAPQLPARAAAEGYTTHFVTDDPTVARLAETADFAQITLVETPPIAAAAPSPEETQLARLMAAALQALDQLRSPFLLWIHARAMAGAWDAPRELRERFVGAEDPSPPTFVEPPALVLPENVDPDEVLGLTQAYAGQVIVADMTLGALLDGLAEHPAARETLLLVTSPRGFPLGEHRSVGAATESLYGELTHLPLFVRFPENPTPQRTHSLVQPADVAATLTNWLGLGELAQFGQSLRRLADGQPWPRQRSVAISGPEQSLRTPTWLFHCRETPANSEAVPPCELFVKPDDYWEVNNVASRCGPIVELMQAALVEFVVAAKTDLLDRLPPLPAELVVASD